MESKIQKRSVTPACLLQLIEDIKSNILCDHVGYLILVYSTLEVEELPCSCMSTVESVSNTIISPAAEVIGCGEGGLKGMVDLKVTSFDYVFVTCSFIITSSVSARQWK
jgi:hypothetical protein